MTGDGDLLRVDPEMLDRLGNDLRTSAEGLPEAPPPFIVTGADAISQAISERLPGVEGPIQEALPQLKQAATTTASNIVAAAGKYGSTDEQLAANYEKHQFDQGAPGADGSGGGAGGGSDAMGQMGQLMSMPMQMASQAVQMPMQAMSAVTSLPQTVMQGVQQIGQMTGGLGKSDGASGEPGDPNAEQPQDRPDEDKTKQDPQHGATPGESRGERAPEPKTGGGLHSASPAEPHVPQQGSPRHAAPDPTVNL